MLLKQSPGLSYISQIINCKLHVPRLTSPVSRSAREAESSNPNSLHHGFVTIRPQAMCSALTSKSSGPLATLIPRTSRTVLMRHVRMSQSSLHQCLSSRPDQAAMQLRHLGSNPRDRIQASVTTPKKPASSTKQSRLSVLDRMGANRTTKIVIIVFLCIYGTMETIFYANAAYRYFSKEDGEEGR